MIVRHFSPHELDWINEQYAGIGFVPSHQGHVIAVAEVDGQNAAIGRIIPITATEGELGGMYVLPNFRGRALASLIIEFLLQKCELPSLYCIPFAHLSNLYAKHGFALIETHASIPAKVQEKFQWCQKQYSEQVLLMVRHSPKSSAAQTQVPSATPKNAGHVG